MQIQNQSKSEQQGTVNRFQVLQEQSQMLLQMTNQLAETTEKLFSPIEKKNKNGESQMTEQLASVFTSQVTGLGLT